jgi:hypothetical protein
MHAAARKYEKARLHSMMNDDDDDSESKTNK